jgi:two-component system, cell cycle sensor histidine kinase and response regulator CckA
MTEATEPSRQPVVLVVDDEATVRRMVVRILREGGYEAIEAGDGLEALKVVEDWLWPIDLVLTDIKMPVLDGIRLGQAIADVRPDLPLAYMSGFGPEATNMLRADLLEACFIAKPFSADALLTLVRRCLKPPATAEA